METDGNRLYYFLFILILFVLIKMIYSAFEYAVLEVNENKVKSLAEKDSKYDKLLKLISSPKNIETIFSIHNIFSDIVISIMSILIFNGYLNRILMEYIPYKLLSETISIFIILIIEVIILVIFTKILPIKIASKNIDSVSLKSVEFINILTLILSPLSMIINGISTVLCKLFKLDSNNLQETATEEEILMMVEETGDIKESQKDMINNIFDFCDVTIPDVMTHRKDIIAVDIKSKIADIVYTSIKEGFSRIPVYQDNIDNIIGIICVKDLLCLVGCEHLEDFTVSHFMRQVPYISEYSKCSEIFEMMTIKKHQMAIVVDEYGGTAGLVTIEDLIEQIVGDIEDEFDQEDTAIDEISEGVFIIDGSTDPEDISKKLNISLPTEHNYDTMSAFIVDLLGHIPNEDDISVVEYQGVIFTVLLVEDNWISKIKAIIKR